MKAAGRSDGGNYGAQGALVTGASRGIRRGIALKLAESGARVAIRYHMNEPAAKAPLEQAGKYGRDGFLVRADVSRVDGEVTEVFGALHVFVANARPEAVLSGHIYHHLAARRFGSGICA